MKIESKDKLIELLYKILPYSNQITNLDSTSESEAIRFEWRENKIRLSLSGSCEEINNGCLIGTDLCILLKQLLKITYYDEQRNF